MSKNKLILAVTVLVLFSIVSIVIIVNNKVVYTPVYSSISSSTLKEYTLSDILGHSNSSSCWSVINGNVYDLTPWISKHPGGQEAIISMCGRDASEAYNSQHGGQKRPANELATFIIGKIK